MTYECAICLNVNHASKLACSTCGTIPARYSVSGRPESAVCNFNWQYGGWGIGSRRIEVVVAHGADRAEHHHTTRSYMRTVPLDYYA